MIPLFFVPKKVPRLARFVHQLFYPSFRTTILPWAPSYALEPVSTLGAGNLFTHTERALAMARLRHFPLTLAVRISQDDSLKLQQLCTATQRSAGELVRQLVRLAQPTHLPAVLLPVVKEEG